MPRDSSGTYSRPSGNPVTTGTPITATWGNTTTADVATELTDSLSRSGKGGMLAPLLFTGITATIKGGIADGASAVAAILDNVGALANAAAKLVSVRNNGVEKLAVDKDGGILAAAAGAALTLKGTIADGASAVAVIIDNTVALANGAAKLVSFRSNGSEKAYVNGAGKGFFVGLDAGSQALASLADPTNDTDAATKGWTRAGAGGELALNGSGVGQSPGNQVIIGYDGVSEVKVTVDATDFGSVAFRGDIGRPVAGGRVSNAAALQAGSFGVSAAARVGGAPTGRYVLTVPLADAASVVVVTPGNNGAFGTGLVLSAGATPGSVSVDARDNAGNFIDAEFVVTVFRGTP